MNDEYIVPIIKRPTFNMSRFKKPTSRARNAKEALIEEIVSLCRCRSEKERATLTRRIAITANTFGWTETDLHALMKKHKDPSVRNYGALVNHMVKVRKRDAVN